MAGKILLVDDYASTRSALSMSLRREGYQVVALDDGREAARRIASESFDLVLSDFSMAGMDGLTLARHVSRVAPHPPVIIMSGSLVITHNDVLNAGAFDLVEKPFSLTSLIGKIELAFATGTPQRTSESEFKEERRFIA